MAYKKPQDPLTNNGFGIYPLTTADQVILSDGSRLEKNGLVSVDVATAVNSEKLGGKTWAERLLDIYPIGSIYMSVSATSPASLFGGTWESIGGRFLLGADATYAAGSTGGEATHTLVISEMPNHAHGMNMISKEYAAAPPNFAFNYQYTSSEVLVGYTNTNGGGNPHNNMPPYLSVYMWKRVS